MQRGTPLSCFHRLMLVNLLPAQFHHISQLFSCYTKQMYIISYIGTVVIVAKKEESKKSFPKEKAIFSLGIPTGHSNRDKERRNRKPHRETSPVISNSRYQSLGLKSDVTAGAGMRKRRLHIGIRRSKGEPRILQIRAKGWSRPTLDTVAYKPGRWTRRACARIVADAVEFHWNTIKH